MAAEEGPAQGWASASKDHGQNPEDVDRTSSPTSPREHLDKEAGQDQSEDPIKDSERDKVGNCEGNGNLGKNGQEDSHVDCGQDSSQEVPTDAEEAVEEGADFEDGGDSSGDDSLQTRPTRSSGRGRGRGRRGRGRGRAHGRSRNGEDERDSPMDLGLQLGLRILQDLLNTNSTFLSYPEAKKGMVDYHDVIDKPMWLLEIQRRFDNDEYSSIVDFVKDVRLLLLNTYRYFGPDALETRRALRIEHVLENKLATLPRDLKSQCSLTSTHGIKTSHDDSEGQTSRKSCDFTSHLLESVAGDRAERSSKRTKDLEEGRQLDKEGRGKEILEWEVKVLVAPPAVTQMRTMWEIPLIGHLIQLTVQVLCVQEVPQYEVERMFLMPQASKTLAILMTSLLSPPLQRSKLHLIPPMPYSIWSQKLSQRVAIWYKMFQTRNHDWLKIFELCGIEKDFWNILGDWNQLEDYEFHELSFHQRVWLVKSLCDYLVHNHKTMQDALADHSQKEQNCEFLGEDRHGRQYLHFPQFCSAPGLCTCVRVYRCVVPEEKARSPEISVNNLPVAVKTQRKNFLPTWMKSRGRGRGGKVKALMRKKIGNEINNRKFLSRVVYRMPNGMHIRGRRKRGANRLSDGVLNVQHEEEKPRQEAFITSNDSSLPIVDHPTDSEDKTSLPDTENSGTVLKRQSRSNRKTSQGFYADWSDSDSLSTPSPSSFNSKSKPPRRSFASVCMKSSDSKSNGLKMTLRVSSRDDEVACLKIRDDSQSGNSDDEKIDKSPDVDEDGSSHESGCDEGNNRSLWSIPDSNKKDDSEDDQKSGMSDDFSWDKQPCCKNKEKRPHFNPDWMLLGAEHFELVADSVQGVRELVDNLCEEDDDVGLLQRLRKQSSSSKPLCEENLQHQLSELISEIESLEVKMEMNARKLRWKLFEEWEEFHKRPKDEKDVAESFWLSILEQDIDSTIPDESTELRRKDSLEECNETKDVKEEDLNKQNLDIQDDESQPGNEVRHSLRAKKTKIDNPQQSWLHSDSEEDSSDEEQDDVWEMPGRRRKKRLNTGRSRKNRKDTKSDDETSEKSSSSKKLCDKVLGVAKNFSFEPCSDDKESSQGDENDSQILKHSNKLKVSQKMLPNKLTLDKEGNMFITLGCGTRVQLKNDEDGRIIVPEGFEGLSMISGKTLDQLVGSGKVVQNKKKKPNRPAKRSTTLFPASSQPTEIIQAKEWTPPVMKSTIQMKNVSKTPRGTSVQAKEWTPPLEKKPSPSVTITPASCPEAPQVKTYTNRKKVENQKSVSVPNVSVQLPKKNESTPEEVVVLSDGSDDSIEVIKEAEPKSSNQNGVPRIESVIGNATVDSFAPKPLTKSVTMTPVIKSAPSSESKSKPWSPVISNTISLEPVPSTGRVRSPGAPQVVITAAKKVQARRNLQQTGVYNHPTPNQSFVPINTIPARQAQSQFVPVNQMIPINQFQPVTQVVGMGNQYVMGNSPFPSMGNPYLVNPAPTYQYVPVAPTPVPLPLPVSAFDIGLPPGLTGQIVLANGDNNQFSYAFKLDDGGLIFLSNEQVSRIRAANGGRLTTMVQFQTQ